MKMLFSPRKWLTVLKLSMVLVFLLAACGPSTDALPTAIDLNAISTSDVVTREAQTAVAVAATATRDAVATGNAPATLPPTWTPESVVTDVPQQVVATQPSPDKPTTTGTIFYEFNGDSIAMLAADGSTDELLLVGGKPADLMLSPDDQWLAYTREISENVREVFAMSLFTENVPPEQQYKSVQVSCLGFARTLLPTWSADSRHLAFAASQTVDDPLGIYTADLLGSNQCPVGNHQRGIAQTPFKDITGMTWNINNTQIYFASAAIYGVDAANGTLYPPLTQFTGYGPDSSPVYRPNSTFLYYLKTERDNQTTFVGGTLAQVDTSQFTTFPLQEIRSTVLLAQVIHFSRDGRFLIASGAQSALVQNMEVGSAAIIVDETKFPPQAIFSPDAENAAYIDVGEGPNLVAQIWVVNRRGTNPHQLTTHKEGTISNLTWAAG